MSGTARKMLTAGLAALALGVGVMASTPSQARHRWLPQWGHHGGHWRGRTMGGYDGLGPLDSFIIYGAAPLFFSYGQPCWQYRPVYDARGRYLGRRNVNMCN